jgi:hypothetical protein
MNRKMNYIRFFLVFVLVGLFSSCQSHYTENKTILKAEELLYTFPDSAYSLLIGIKHPEKLSKADNAAWCLHYTHARYKLQKEIKSDSLIQISINYYSNGNLPKYSGTAWYLLGCIHSSHNQKPEAIFAFKKAEDILKLTNENRLKGLVDFNIGYICMQDELYNHSLSYFRKSLKYFDQSGDSKYKAYAYREIANMYNQMNYPFDSVFHYLNIAANLSKKTNDLRNYYHILILQGEMLLQKDCYRSKEYILKAYKYFPAYKPYYAAYLANAYSKLNKQDSAKYYLNISLADTTNTPYKIIGLHSAALIAKSENDYKKAYVYLEKSYLLRDLTYQQNIRSQLYRIDKQYDLTQKEEENARLKIGNRTEIIWIALLVIAVLSVLIVFLLIYNRYKKKQAAVELENQRLKHEAETTQINNTKKRELLGIKIKNKIDNTLQFNKFKRGCLQKGKMETFIQELAKQSIIAEKEWPDYLEDVNEFFENKITDLKEEYTELTIADLIVIVLISLKVSISDACSLLDMNKNTMYTRRKTIKKRLELNSEVELELWINELISEHRFSNNNPIL